MDVSDKISLDNSLKKSKNFNRILSYSKYSKLNLEEIFYDNDLILIDGSIKSECSDFSRTIYDIKSIREVDKNFVNKENNDILNMIDIINRDNAFTINEVSEELYKYVSHIGKCISYFSSNQKGKFLRRRTSLVKKKKFYPHKEEFGEDNLNLLKNLHDNSYKLYNIFKRKSLNISDKRYKLLTEIVELLDNKIGLQRDTSYIHEINKSVPKKSITDDKLVAALYYNCMYLKNKTAILTSDTDFVRIVCVTPFIIGADDFMPYNDTFRKSLDEIKFDIYMYYPGSKMVTKKIFDFPLEYKKEFLINNISNKENEIFKDRIKSLWKEIAECQVCLVLEHNKNL